jgi:D-methionine transport system ATP-binding protein
LHLRCSKAVFPHLDWRIFLPLIMSVSLRIQMRPPPLGSGVSFSLQHAECALVDAVSRDQIVHLFDQISGRAACNPDEIQVCGRDITRVQAMRRRDVLRASVGVTSENHRMLAGHTCFEELNLACRFAGVPQLESRGATLDLLQRVGLSAKADLMARDLSSLDHHRLCLAKSLTWPIDVLLVDTLDDPDCPVTPQERRDFLGELCSIGVAVLGIGGADHRGDARSIWIGPRKKQE